MMKVGLFLRLSRLATGYGQAELAKLVEVSQPTVSRWERGTSFPDALQIEELGRLYQIGKLELGLLHELSNSSDDDELANTSRALERSTMNMLSRNQQHYDTTIPYYAEIAAGLGEVQEQLYEARSKLQIPRELYERDPSSYALRVTGDSMEPMLSEGDLLVISPEATLTPGCIVAACVEPDGDIVKTYHPQADGTVLLKPLNPAYPEVRLNPANGKDARIWGRVVMQQREL